MSTKLLSQAFIVVPTTRSIHRLPPPNKLRFSVTNSTCCKISSARFSVAGVSSSSFGPIIARRARGLVAVRAEDGAGEAGANGEEAGQSVEAVTEAVAADDDSVVTGEELQEDGASEAEAEPKPPRQPRIKLGDIMGILNKKAIEASEQQRPVPSIRTGDIVEIKLEVPENRKRLSVYKGIVMSRQNAGIHTTIRIRRIIAGIGVEIVFPLYSPNIKEIKVVAQRKVRKARLYYLRDKLPRLSTFK